MASYTEKISKMWNDYITLPDIPGRLEFICSDGSIFGPIHILRFACPYIDALVRRNNSTIIEVQHPKKIVRKILNYLLYLEFTTPDFTLEEKFQSYELARYWCIDKLIMKDVPLQLEIEQCIEHLKLAHSYMFDELVKELALMVAQYYHTTNDEKCLAAFNGLIESCPVELRSIILTSILNKNSKPNSFRNYIIGSEVFNIFLPCFLDQRTADSSEFTFECKDGTVVCPKFLIYEICPLFSNINNVMINEEKLGIAIVIITELTGKNKKADNLEEIYCLMHIARKLKLENTLSRLIHSRSLECDLITYLRNIEYCAKYGFEDAIPGYIKLIILRLKKKYIDKNDRNRAETIIGNMPKNVSNQLLLEIMMNTD